MYAKNIKIQEENNALRDDFEFLLKNRKLNEIKLKQIKIYKRNIQSRHNTLDELIHIQEKSHEILNSKLQSKHEIYDEQIDELEKVKKELSELKNLKNALKSSSSNNIQSSSSSSLHGKNKSFRKEINILNVHIMLKEETLKMTQKKIRKQKMQIKFLSDFKELEKKNNDYNSSKSEADSHLTKYSFYTGEEKVNYSNLISRPFNFDKYKKPWK